jgi:hypothetical protein
MYITAGDILGKIPAALLVEGLDHNGDGLEDEGAFASLAAAAALEVDSKLSGRYPVPFQGPDIPPKVKFACVLFFLEGLYAGRGWTNEYSKNPWSREASKLRAELEAIGKGLSPLYPAADRQTPTAVAVSAASTAFTLSHLDC